MTRMAMAAFMLSGCAGNHFALNPASDEAGLIANLWWIMLGAATIIFIIVLALLLISILRGQGGQDRSLDQKKSRRRCHPADRAAFAGGGQHNGGQDQKQAGSSRTAPAVALLTAAL
jgi:hypothetical protein